VGAHTTDELCICHQRGAAFQLCLQLVFGEVDQVVVPGQRRQPATLSRPSANPSGFPRVRGWLVPVGVVQLPDLRGVTGPDGAALPVDDPADEIAAHPGMGGLPGDGITQRVEGLGAAAGPVSGDGLGCGQRGSGDGNLENAACGDRVHSLDGLVEQVVDVDAEHGVDVPIGHASTHELPQVLSDGGSVHEVGGRRSDAAAASTLAFIGACVGVAVLTAAAVAVGGDGAVVASHLGGLLSCGRGRNSGRTAGLDPAETAGGAEGLSIRAAAVVGLGVVAAGAGDEPVVVAAGCGLEATAAAFSDELVFVE